MITSLTLPEKTLSQNGKYVSVDYGNLELRSEYLLKLKKFCEAKKIEAVIDRKYPLEQIVEAHRYVDQKHKKGNVVVTILHCNKKRFVSQFWGRKANT